MPQYASRRQNAGVVLMEDEKAGGGDDERQFYTGDYGDGLGSGPYAVTA
jgi:hypothetical protein